MKCLAIKLARETSEAATRGVLLKKVFLEISQNSQENTCARVSFLHINVMLYIERHNCHSKELSVQTESATGGVL